MNLQQKLLVATLPLSIASMIFLSIIQYSKSKSALLESSEAEMQTAVELIEQQLSLWLEERKNELNVLSEDTAASEILQGDDTRKSNYQFRLSLTHKKSQNYDSIVLLNQDGKVVLNSNENRSIGLRLSETEGFSKALKNHSVDASFDSATLSPVNGKSILFLAWPINHNGKFLGHLGGTIHLAKLTEKITDKIKFGNSGYPFIVDQDGRVLAHPDSSQILKLNIKSFDWSNQMLMQKNGKIIYHFAGKDKINIFNTLDLLNWKIAASATLDEFYQQIEALKIIAIIITSIISLTIFLLVYFITKKIGSSINQVCNNVAQGSTEILSAAGALSESSQTLSSATTEQASSIEETSSSLEELTSMVGQNLESARTSSMMADEMAKVSEIAHEYTEQLYDAMNTMKSSNIEVKELVGIINGISERTKVIDEIVFQTKLLSFNASVEAERAGEHGRGFAVVAQEVGNLAQMSGKAAQEISSILKQSIEKSVSVTSNNEKNVAQGAELLEHLRKIVKQIAETASQVSDHANKITSASNEQHLGLKQINIAVNQLDQTTQSSSAISEETAAASEELNQLANSLRMSIGLLEQIVSGKKSEPHIVEKKIAKKTHLITKSSPPKGDWDQL